MTALAHERVGSTESPLQINESPLKNVTLNLNEASKMYLPRKSMETTSTVNNLSEKEDNYFDSCQETSGEIYTIIFKDVGDRA
jgi:hypothetical protein